MLYRLAILIAISLFRKVGKGFWVLRLLRSPRGSYIQPHLSITWQIWSLVFLCGIQIYLWGVHSRFQGIDLPVLTAWGPFAYYPMWAGGWFAIWALSVSKAAMLASDVTGLQRLVSAPLFLNVLFLLGHLIVFSVLSACCGSIYHFYVLNPVHAAAAAAVLAALAPTYNATLPANATLDIIRKDFGPALQKVFTGSNMVAGWFQVTWTVWFIAALLLNICLSKHSPAGWRSETATRDIPPK
ncbi:hypothetical protein RQP46_009790 [Phenoliferia psychrophenolica]